MAADPDHPHENPRPSRRICKTEVLEPLGLTVTEAAQALGITRAALSAILNERASLSPEMAIRIGKAFGVSIATLMRMRSSFDIAQAHKKEADIAFSRYIPKVPSVVKLVEDPNPALAPVPLPARIPNRRERRIHAPQRLRQGGDRSPIRVIQP